MPAEDSCMHAEMKKSAGENRFFQWVAEIVERQKEKGCYSISPYGHVSHHLGDFSAEFVTG